MGPSKHRHMATSKTSYRRLDVRFCLSPSKDIYKSAQHLHLSLLLVSCRASHFKIRYISNSIANSICLKTLQAQSDVLFSLF